MTQIHRIYQHRKLRFDFTHGGRERVRKGFTYEKGSGSGRSKSPNAYTESLQRTLADPANLMFLYPGHYDLAVVDVDTPVVKGLYEFLPPLHHSLSRSGTRRGGHLWYSKPRHPGDLKPLKPREFTLRGDRYTVDIQYTQLLRVPAQQIAGVLKLIADWLENPPRPVAFPYELLGLCCVKGERDTKWWHYILAQTEQLGDPELTSVERWHEVAEETGYFADNSEQAFLETFYKATGKAKTSGASSQAYPFAEEGAVQIFDQLNYRYRYNIRSGHTELSKGTGDWQSMSDDMPRRWFVDAIRKGFRETRGRGDPPQWEPLNNWTNFIDWLDTYAARQSIYDPIAQHIEDWQNAEPLSNKESLLLNLFSPATEEPRLADQIRNVELNMLLTLYTRLYTGQRTGVPASVHFPYLPTFVGPPGCGKTRFCISLGLTHYHTNDISFDDPPKEFGEKAQIAVVAEMEELKEMLGRRGSQRRGQAKKYINQTKFDYRAAYARGKASTHHLMGIMLATSNYPVDISPDDGLWRRIIHLPVQRHPRFTGNLDEWDVVFDELFPRAMSRAARHHEAQKRPRIDEALVVNSLHEQVYSLEVVDGRWEPRTAAGAEFD